MDRLETIRRRVPTDVGSLIGSFEDLLALASAVALVAMMFAITGGAIARYVFNDPIAGLLGVIALYLMPLVIFGVGAMLQRREEHIQVDVFSRNFPTRVNDAIRITGRLMTLVVFGILAYLALEQAGGLIQAGRSRPGAVNLPVGYSWLIVGVGLLALCVRLVYQLAVDLWTLSPLHTDADGDSGPETADSGPRREVDLGASHDVDLGPHHDDADGDTGHGDANEDTGHGDANEDTGRGDADRDSSSEEDR